MEVLKLDQTGACYVVYPDIPMLDFPNPNFGLLFSMIAFGKYIASPLGIKAFGVKSFAIFCLLAFLLFQIVVMYIFAQFI
jgi:hypothetical protein